MMMFRIGIALRVTTEIKQDVSPLIGLMERIKRNFLHTFLREVWDIFEYGLIGIV